MRVRLNFETILTDNCIFSLLAVCTFERSLCSHDSLRTWLMAFEHAE